MNYVVCCVGIYIISSQYKYLKRMDMGKEIKGNICVPIVCT